MHMKRAFHGTAVALALCLASPALADKTKLGPDVHGKTSSVGEIASSLASTGRVRVIVEVHMEGVSKSSMEAAVREANSRTAMKAQIRTAIDGVIADHNLGAQGVGSGQAAITRLTTVPAFAATVSAEALERLAKDPRVRAINHDRPMRKHLDQTLPLIGMPAVHAGGGTGTGRAVVVIDDGVQRDHVFLGLSRLIAGREACFLDNNNCPNGTNEQIGSGAGAATVGSEHGTHVAGIALGNRSAGTPNKGMAIASSLIPINIFGPNSGTSFSTIQRAFEHVEDLVLLNSGTNPLNIAAINMSVGGGSSSGNCDSDATMVLLKPVIDNLRSKGVLSAISAGNSYSTSTMSFPACLSSMVSVAATSRTGVVASYTSISPTTDLFAPGGEDNSCVLSSVPTNAFDQFCGTSMASPHVAGAIAVLRQKVPAASACRIEEALKVTGIATTDTRSGGTQTKPRIQVNAALSRLLAPTAPANNNFANATVIPAGAALASFGGTNIGATLQAGEARHVVATSNGSVWWKWTPTVSGTVTLDTIGSGIDTVLAVYRGGTTVANPGALVAQNDNIAAGVTASQVGFTAVAGQTYNIVVAGKTATEKCFLALNLKRPPANDNFAQARTVTVTASSEVGVGGSNIDATKQPGEPNHNGNPSHTSSVWFKFTAPVSGSITIDTEGSLMSDTVLAVYTGNAVNALTAVASDDDSGSGLWSKLSFNMVAGTQYNVAVVGYSSARGRYRLWFTPAGAMRVDRNALAKDDD